MSGSGCGERCRSDELKDTEKSATSSPDHPRSGELRLRGETFCSRNSPECGVLKLTKNREPVGLHPPLAKLFGNFSGAITRVLANCGYADKLLVAATRQSAGF
jgi:hypothetical protein